MDERKTFLTTQVGSWPRSRQMLKTLHGHQKGTVSRAEFNKVADDEIRRTVALQEQAGLDILVDGEHRRESFYAFITDKVAGTQLMSLADMLDFVEDKAEFEEMLRTMDMPASAVKNPYLHRQTHQKRTASGKRPAFPQDSYQKTNQDYSSRPLPAHPIYVDRITHPQGVSKS